ncbi:phosphoribosyl-ATP pyrophosphatase [Streptococcus rubneri]|uniref:Phosphoribosyl-ATP pyrophosphatase n=1 Tax=Streptococcus rubneri TaxID=1234680 RepID=A0A4Z1DXS2_9STRE|nr:phosphoribosyl-ATP pyrophosphatase [Streptococcus rubneri]TGN91674.1 phosphoribosyl-ATP pyrophosphatase [Streptococcus rubneri]
MGNGTSADDTEFQHGSSFQSGIYWFHYIMFHPKKMEWAFLIGMEDRREGLLGRLMKILRKKV